MAAGREVRNAAAAARAALALTVLLLAAGAYALEPGEVLVVANANAEGSEALGKYYCLARNLPPDRLLVVRTAAGPDVSRADYEAQIRQPVRQHLQAQAWGPRVRCILLVWGMPLRVGGSGRLGKEEAILAIFRQHGVRMAGRLGVNLKLLQSVGRQFPEPRGTGLRPVAQLFDPATTGNPDTALAMDRLQAEFVRLLELRTREVAKLEDPAKRHIALRQLAALRLDTLGAEDLLTHWPEENVEGLPLPGDLERQAEDDLVLLQRRSQELLEPAHARELVERTLALRGLVAAQKLCKAAAFGVENEDAALDSELSLVWEEGYPLAGWLPNALNWRVSSAAASGASAPALPRRTLMVARLDGPRPKDALRMLKDSVEVEKQGLDGTFYIDSGGPYPFYEPHLLNLAAAVERTTKLPVKLDRNKALFGPNTCPGAALYVGWYSVENYVPAFEWKKGSVGYHLASLEAVDLRDPQSRQWCPRMIQGGVAATLGAVAEPFLSAFPPPEEFFALLLTGRLTLGECYWRTLPSTSWRMTLIGDPLYNPFKARPQVPWEALPPAMRQGSGQ